MPRKRLRASWIGHNDMRAFAMSLPVKPRDEIRILSNFLRQWEKGFSKWLDKTLRQMLVEKHQLEAMIR